MLNDEVFRKLIRPGDTVFDIGANAGQSAEVFSALVGTQGTCISFECHPKYFSYLSRLAAAHPNQNIRPFCKALSDRCGHAKLFFGDADHATSASTIVPELANESRLGHVSACLIETDTLDHFCVVQDLRPDFIKIDVEGAEQQVFDGGVELISKSRPLIVFEFGYGIDETGRFPAHFGFLRRLGFELVVSDIFWWRGEAFSAPQEKLPNSLCRYTEAELTSVAPVGGNMLAVPGERVNEVLSLFDIRSFAEIIPAIDRLQRTYKPKAEARAKWSVKRIVLDFLRAKRKKRRAKNKWRKSGTRAR